MIKQYTAIGIATTVWTIQKREDIMKNLRRIAKQVRAMKWSAELDLPVRLVALPELAITGAPDEVLGKHLDHVRAANEVYIDIPGEETEFLGKLCKQQGFYLIAQAKGRDPDLMPDRLFNMAFIIDPEGKVIHKHHKTSVFPREHPLCPSDIWDVYLKKYGDDPEKLLQAVFPVARTEIGNIGTLICAEGCFPEAARGLALNGAEIIYRAAYLEPWVGNDTFEIENRSHAVFNNCYVLAPNTGVCHSMPWTYKDWTDAWPVDYSGNRSLIIDYRGQIIGQHRGSADSFCSGIINIEALRDFRVRALWQNHLKNMRAEEYSIIYKAAENMGGIYPKNLWLEAPPWSDEPEDMLRKWVINKLVDKGIYTPPSDWQPYAISQEVLERIDSAAKRHPAL